MHRPAYHLCCWLSNRATIVWLFSRPLLGFWLPAPYYVVAARLMAFSTVAAMFIGILAAQPTWAQQSSDVYQRLTRVESNVVVGGAIISVLLAGNLWSIFKLISGLNTHKSDIELKLAAQNEKFYKLGVRFAQHESDSKNLVGVLRRLEKKLPAEPDEDDV